MVVLVPVPVLELVLVSAQALVPAQALRSRQKLS